MAIVIADIKAAFPEFSVTNADALITAKIASAELQLDRTLFADTAQADEAIKWLTAHLLALSPSGINARLSAKDGSSIYWDRYRSLALGASAGYRVP